MKVGESLNWYKHINQWTYDTIWFIPSIQYNSRNCRSHVNFQSALSEGLNVFKMKITTTLPWLKEEKKEFKFRPWGKNGAGTLKMNYFVFHCITQVPAFEIIQMPFSNWQCTTCIKIHLSKLHCSKRCGEKMVLTGMAINKFAEGCKE